MSDITAILTNWKRPANLLPIIDSLRGQSVPPAKIVIVDNHPAPENGQSFHLVTKDGRAVEMPQDIGVDEIIRCHNNYGPPSRFVAGVFHDTKYLLFLDDDFVPARRAIEHLTATAKFLGNKENPTGEFSTIGELGRLFDYRMRGKWRYRSTNVARTNGLRPVDLTVRSHLVRSDLMPFVYEFRMRARKQFGDFAGLRIHDDMQLCQGLQIATGWPSFLTPMADGERSLVARELPAPHAVCNRKEHRRERDQMIAQCAEMDWRPLSGNEQYEREQRQLARRRAQRAG